LNLRSYLAVGQPAVLLQLDITYSDGSKDRIHTDETWQVGSGAIIRNNIYLGEVYDARLESSGWNTFAFDAHDFSTAMRIPAPPGKLEAMMVEPVIFKPIPLKVINITQPHAGVPIYIADMGKNYAGIHLHFKGYY